VNGAQEEIVDLRYLSTTASLCCIPSGGDIVLIKTEAEEYDEKVEIIGNMEGGILAAQWTLDEEILAIASGSTTHPSIFTSGTNSLEGTQSSYS
jgi:elongator complex protein 1